MVNIHPKDYQSDAFKQTMHELKLSVYWLAVQAAVEVDKSPLCR